MPCPSCPDHKAPPRPPAPPPAPPSLPAKVLAAMSAFARFTLGGMRVASAAEQAARQAACDPCPWRDGGTCRACGCLLEIKTWMPAEHCPHGRWPLA